MANTFFWRCEGTTLDGTHDNSAGDTTATANDSAAINTAQVKVGTNSHDCATGSSYYSFDLASDIVLSAGSAGFWIYPDNWAAGMIFWQALDVSSTADHISLTKTGSSGSGGITLEVRDAGFGNSTITTGDLGITTGNWYFVTFGWSESATSLYIHVFDNTLTELAAATEDTAVAANYFPPWANLDVLRLGHQSGTGNSAHFDNYMISDSYSEDLVSNANITSYTSWGGGGGANPKGVLGGLVLGGPFGGPIG